MPTSSIAVPLPAWPDLSSDRIQLFRHELASSGLFRDEALTELFDTYPREDLHVTTMGDSFAEGGWRTGRVPEMPGADLLRAIRSGHLWLNIKRLDRNAARYAWLMHDAYEAIAEAFGRRAPRWLSATLLVSSPGAFVHYHADSVPNILWHLRGRKRVHVYPARSERYASATELEAICAGAEDEGLRYDESLEDGAQVFELEPGQAITWPQHSPHRVVNVEGLNVSLSTEHMYPEHRRRVQILRANRILRRLRLTPRSSDGGGLVANGKLALALAGRAFGKLRGRDAIQYEIPASFYVDADAPRGFRDARD